MEPTVDKRVFAYPVADGQRHRERHILEGRAEKPARPTTVRAPGQAGHAVALVDVDVLVVPGALDRLFE